jgi:23S rRNA pseudouridine1911/1915/1917 synthase
MAETTHIVPEDADQTTIAAAVRAMFDGLSWSRARALVASGRVLVDGEVIFDPAVRVAAGSKVRADQTAKRKAALSLPDDALIFVDHDLAVVLKPSGVETVPYDETKRDTTSLLAMTLQNLIDGQRKRGGVVQRGLGVVQRLDKETSGVLVFPRTHAARKTLQAQFRRRAISRRYVALVKGIPTEQSVETQLVANRGDGKRGSWRGSGKPPHDARLAITHISLLEEFNEAALVECRLETGRQHQIRIHLADLGHPLFGDRVYGPRATTTVAGPTRRTMLHAASLGFNHPSDGRPMHFVAPTPTDMAQLLHSLRNGERV